MYLFHHHFCPAAGRMSKIAQLWKDLSELVWAVKAKSAWDAWRETVANLPEDVRFEDRCLAFFCREIEERRLGTSQTYGKTVAFTQLESRSISFLIKANQK